jgi:predicted dehydrogenase
MYATGKHATEISKGWKECSMPKRVGIGLVGLDHWYTAFSVLDHASKGANIHMVGVADRSRKRLSEIAQKYSPDYVTSDPRKVIADANIELICCQLNTRDNVGVVRQALRAGKHVACVKPMAMTLRQADALIQLAEDQGLVLWSFDQLGGARAGHLQSLIRRGAIGQPISFYQTMWAGLPMPWHDRTGPSWWVDPELAPFGAWADHAIYTIAMLRALLDDEVVAVQGQMSNQRHRRLKLEDYGVATLQFTSGLVAVIEQTWTGGPYYPHWTKIVGTKGVIHMDQAVSKGAPMLATERGIKPIRMPATRRGGSLDAVLSLMRKGQAKPSPARQSRTNLAVAFAAYKSASTGREIRL